MPEIDSPVRQRRPLTPGEIALCRAVFPDELPYAAVRLVGGARLNPVARIAFLNPRTAAITLRRTIYFKHGLRPDFSDPSDERARSLFVHEMTHIWQWQQLGVPRFLLRYARDFAACRFNAGLMYEYEDDGVPFAQCRLEAQAQIAGDFQRSDSRRRLIAGKLKETGFYRT